MKVLIFVAVIKDGKRIILLKIATKTHVCSKFMSSYFMQRPFTVHELPPLLFKRFSTIMHYSVMSQMILTSMNISQILKIDLLIYLKS